MATINELLDTIPEEPLTPTIDMTPRWRLFFEQFQMMLGRIGGIVWAQISKIGSRLSDLETRPHSDLQNVYGASTPNIATLAASGVEVLHVSLEQTQRWDTLRGSSSNAEVLHWFF